MTHIERVAYCCECSTRYIDYVLHGQRKGKGELGENIRVASILIEEKQTLLLEEVKRILKF